MDILEFLSREGVSDRLLQKIENFRKTYSSNTDSVRIPKPMYN